MGALSESGTFGDATVATAEKGARFEAMWVDCTVALWTEFLGAST